jgi:flagellar P-ring protein precursor FlgI
MILRLSALLGVLVLGSIFVSPPTADAVRIKDIGVIEGVRENQLLGYGLVVGLDSTGD